MRVFRALHHREFSKKPNPISVPEMTEFPRHYFDGQSQAKLHASIKISHVSFYPTFS